ncbi:NYN domain-containing protein [Lacipirellula parvula]|uniref:NYN domain-containing protein n=1 Tax=Lacipirellula parvula TaxID=2650471 RepID=A0A5K7X837_9BACT|nr:NYN domain-containing protein [Lacipirellula parvula]BBO31967.1 hypothetical protein PLANPX_1579 [Lacipirellula parvula]
MGRHGFDRKDRNYLFIDGGYLRERINQFAKDFFGIEHFGWDCEHISERYFKTFYYDCPPDDKATHRGEEYRECIAATKRLPGVHVAEGVLTSGRKQQQKQVDVKLAVDMLSHTLNRNMDSVTLLAGDQDFVPAIEALVRAGMYVSLMYVHTSISPRLRDAADEGSTLDFRDLYFACSDAFRGANKLVTESSFVIGGVEHHFAREGRAVDRWHLIGSGNTESGQLARLAKIFPESHFALLIDSGEGQVLRYSHPDAHILCRQVEALGHSFKVSKITAEYRDAFPAHVQELTKPAARPAGLVE